MQVALQIRERGTLGDTAREMTTWEVGQDLRNVNKLYMDTLQVETHQWSCYDGDRH